MFLDVGELNEMRKLAHAKRSMLSVLSVVVTCLGLAWISARGEAADTATRDDSTYTQMPSTEEIFAWIIDLWRIGDQGKYGYRMPGSAADHQAASYMQDKFREFGLQDVHRELVPIPASFPEEWSLRVHVNGQTKEIPCWFVRYAAFTPPEGVTAEMVYVGQGSEEEFQTRNETTPVAGKIVVVDLISKGLSYAFWSQDALFTYDPNNTLPGDMFTENFPVFNIRQSIDLARRYGAVGFIGILTFSAKNNSQYYHGDKVGNVVISAVTVSPSSGDVLKKLMAAGPVKATLSLTEQEEPYRHERAGARSFGKWGATYNVYGSLPGTTNEVIAVMTHHDGGATNEASGVSVVMALAKYFAQFPQQSRQKTLLFLAAGSHFGLRPPILDQARGLASVTDKLACLINIEMIGKQYKIVDGEYVETGLAAPTFYGVSDGNPRLVSFVRDAITKHKLDRSTISRRFVGEGGPLNRAGLTVIEHLSMHAREFTKDDTPETVMKEALRPTANAFVDIIRQIDPIPASDFSAETSDAVRR